MMFYHSWTRLVLVPAILTGMSTALCFGVGSEYYFPQVADGVSGNIFYTSSFLINNSQAKSNQVTIRFTLPNALPWIIDLRCLDRPELAGRVATRTFSLNAGENLLLFTGGVDPLGTGWAKIESSLPLDVSEVFDVISTSSNLQVNSEAGVLPASPTTQFSFFAAEAGNEPANGTSVDTGFALVNPSGGVAQVTATVYSRFGTFLGQHLFTMLPGTQIAQFLSQLFNDVNTADIARHGRVRFSSNVNLAVVALRQTYGNSNTISAISVHPDSELALNTIYDREPNDTRGTAQAIGALPATVTGTINSTADGPDVDTYSVSLKAGAVLYVVVLTDMIGSDLNCSLQVQDTNGNSLITNTFPTGLKGPILSFLVPTDGTYLISLSGTNHGRDSYYRMILMSQ